jgi:excisionase family DNA binding protein
MESRFMTVKEVADLLRVNKMTIYRAIKAKKMTAYKVGKDYRIKDDEFNHYLNKIKKGAK